MTTTLDLNQGALAPVADEVTLTDLEVSGSIPADLNGTLLRNGPNPFSGRFQGNGVLSWWPEAAMLHALTIADGRACLYKNRWVRTQNWARFHKQATGDWVNSNPNVNLLQHGGHVLALAEGGPPVAVNRHLQTLGTPTTHQHTQNGMTAHPKVDPISSELIWFRAGWQPPYVRYGVTGRDGKAIHESVIETTAPTMMHDLAITENFSILLDLSVGYDFSMLQQGFRLPLCWQPQKPSQILVVPRYGGKVQRLEIEPCFIQHVVNAYESAADQLVLDAVRYPWYFKRNGNGLHPDPLGTLWRYHIDLSRNNVRATERGSMHVEMPRINESYTGRAARYGYFVQQPSETEMRGLVRIDLENNETVTHPIAPGNQNSEPIFVARTEAEAEDDGYLLTCVYNANRDASEVHILNARDISEPALAIIHLRRRIPAGFHGMWLPDEA